MPDIYIRQHNGVLWLILTRQPGNMLTVGMLEQLAVVLEKALHKSPSLIVLTGAGDEAFCSGIESPKVALRKLLAPVAEKMAKVMQRLHEQHIPVVALVKGKALEVGAELAALCDIIIARDDAVFQFPPAEECMFSDVLLHSLPALIGKDETAQLLRAPIAIDAQQAFHMGLVQQVIPARRFTQDAEELLVMLSFTPLS